MKYIFILIIILLGFSIQAQQAEYVDFRSCKAKIDFDILQNKIFGYVTYDFEILNSVDAIYIDAKDMRFMNVKLYYKGMPEDNHFMGAVDHYNNDRRLIIEHDFKKKKKYQLRFRFFANPKKAMYFIDWEHEKGNKQIWTQGQGKYTSSWLPSIDDMNDKIEFDLSITFDNEYEVIANGKLINKEVKKEVTNWDFDMQQPMSSYLVALAIGKYNKKVEYSKSGIPLEMYYYSEDSLKFEPTYRYTKQMFDFLEEEIGLPYPWQNYKQVPVKDFLYAGMENTSTTIFSDAFVVDSIAFVDKNYVNVNAHELAHQWFGDLVTETSGTHHWLQEGFATYYALLAEREVFGVGDDYYYWQLYEYAQELLEQDKAGGSTSLLDPKSSSTTFYKKGAWVLHLLRERIGDEAFKKGVKNYLLKHQFKNVETDDFIGEIEKASGENLSEFVETWLEEKELPISEMYSALEKNDKTSFLITIEETPYLSYRTDDNNGYIASSLVTTLPNGYYPIKNAVLAELIEKPDYPTYKDLLLEVFQSNDIYVRQALARLINEIPSELKTEYETLLNDKSYRTIEIALFNLWQNFPRKRNEYFNKTKGIIGFNDKNVRMLWLTLALITDDFEVENKKQYFDELTDYTSSKYGFEVRQNAFQYLNQIQACNDDCKDNLKQATTHHNWRFSKFAKTMLKVLKN